MLAKHLRISFLNTVLPPFAVRKTSRGTISFRKIKSKRRPNRQRPRYVHKIRFSSPPTTIRALDRTNNWKPEIESSCSKPLKMSSYGFERGRNGPHTLKSTKTLENLLLRQRNTLMPQNYTRNKKEKKLNSQQSILESRFINQ